MATRKTLKSAKKKQQAKTYTHSDQDALIRPEGGTQAQLVVKTVEEGRGV